MLIRSGLIVNRKKVKRQMKYLNLLHSHRKTFRKSVPRAIVVTRPNPFWETDFMKVYINGKGWFFYRIHRSVLKED